MEVDWIGPIPVIEWTFQGKLFLAGKHTNEELNGCAGSGIVIELAFVASFVR